MKTGNGKGTHRAAAQTWFRSRRGVLLICVGLAALTLLALGGVVKGGFLEDFDDDEYVTRNPFIQGGLTSRGVWWALTAFHSNNWHPLTWLSLQLDTSLFGSAAWGYHLTNLLLHTLNVLLLFAVLYRMTGAQGQSAMVAALFAIHPLHVESVAWVSERKDVLAGLFWLLTIWAYVRYAERPGPARYLLVTLLFVLGLAAKPMLVTLPGVLLLLDYWPLRRMGDPASATQPVGTAFRWRVALRRLAEKVPLLVLAVLASAATVAAQKGVLQDGEQFPLSTRVLNALMAYVAYLKQTFWPTRLAFFYPHSATEVPLWQGLLAALFLIAVTLLVLFPGRRRPYLAVGWLWYLGTLVPVIGLVQVGLQMRADRYTYLPLIGIFLLVVWGVADLLARLPSSRAVLTGCTAAVLAVCLVLTHIQVGYWQDGETLWRHTLEVTDDNFMAHHHLGMYRMKQGDLSEARRHFLESRRIKPRIAAVHASLGVIAFRQGNLPESIRCYQAALECNPALADAHRDLGSVYMQQGDLTRAARHLEEAIRLRPRDAGARARLARVLSRQGKLSEAARTYESALKEMQDQGMGRSAEYARRCQECGQVLGRLGRWEESVAYHRQAVAVDPRQALYHCFLAYALEEKGDSTAAAQEYRVALRLDPSWPQGANGAARALATRADGRGRDPDLAVELARAACAGTDNPPPEFLDTLAAAYAGAGRFKEAEQAAQKALERAESTNPSLAAQIKDHLRLYRQRKPLRES